MGNGVEFRVMPNDEDGRWYWEVIKDGREVVARGIADTESAAFTLFEQMGRKTVSQSVDSDQLAQPGGLGRSPACQPDVLDRRGPWRRTSPALVRRASHSVQGRCRGKAREQCQRRP